MIFKIDSLGSLLPYALHAKGTDDNDMDVLTLLLFYYSKKKYF